MSRDFEELDYRETPLGELILRRRRLVVVRPLRQASSPSRHAVQPWRRFA
jgi:hypothetical protein